MDSSDQAFRLPRFQARLNNTSARKLGMAVHTHLRYKKGLLPRALLAFLIAHPDFAEALIADILEAANQRSPD